MCVREIPRRYHLICSDVCAFVCLFFKVLMHITRFKTQNSVINNLVCTNRYVSEIKEPMRPTEHCKGFLYEYVCVPGEENI